MAAQGGVNYYKGQRGSSRDAAESHEAQAQGREGQQAQLRNVCNYLYRNRDCMRYDEYLAAGLPIASGAIEGACKNLVKARMEGPGIGGVGRPRQCCGCGHVPPYLRESEPPSLWEFDAVGAFAGTVRLQVKLSATGTVQHVRIVRSAGRPRADRQAQGLASRPLWLPTLRRGTPVEYTFEYNVIFMPQSR